MPEPANSALDDARKRARRRLVGAIVLALGAAVVVPVFLESDPKPLGPDVQIQIPAVDDAKFQNRLTPQQKGAATDKAPQAAPAAGSRPADAKQPETAGTLPPKQAEPAGTAAGGPTSMQAPKGDAAPGAAAAPAGASTAETKSAPKSTPAEAAASAAPQAATGADAAPKQAGKKAAPPKKAAPATTEQAPATNLGTATLNTAPPAASKSGEFVVQIGAFADKTVATEMAAKAGEQGFPVFLEGVTTKSGPVQRVRVGPFPNKAAADAAATRLTAAGFTAEARPR